MNRVVVAVQGEPDSGYRAVINNMDAGNAVPVGLDHASSKIRDNSTGYTSSSVTSEATPSAIATAIAASILFTDRSFDSQWLPHLSSSGTADMIADMRTG